MSDKMKVRDGKDGYSYPYTSPDLVIDNNGKSNTSKFNDIDTQLKDIAKKTITDDERNKLSNLKNYDDSGIKVTINNKADKNEVFSMANMGQDIKEAMTGGSVAVVGNDSIRANNIVDGQVKLIKIDNHLRDCFYEDMGEYINNSTEIETGWLHYNNNTIQSDDKRKVYNFIVSPGDKIQVTGYVLGNSALVKGFNSNGNCIFVFPNTKTNVATLYENYEFIVPNDVVKIKYCNFYSPYVGNSNYSIDDSFKIVMDVKLKTDKLNKAISEVLNEENKLLKEKITELQLCNDFAWKEFDKVYITFTFDDSNDDISDIENLFKLKGVPVCFAAIPSKLNNTCTDGTKVIDVLKRCEGNGGEILSHYHKPLTSESTDDDYNQVYIQTKKELESNDLTIDGIITTGGNNYNTQDFSKCIDIARIYYKYADRTAESTNLQHIEQFWNPRVFMDGNENKCKTKIDEVVLSGSGWIRFASHGKINNDTVELIGKIIDYATSKGCKIVTWRQMYNKFKTTKLEKRLLALENK